ncbi:unnamed protein product [Urochloa humidicola]
MPPPPLPHFLLLRSQTLTPLFWRSPSCGRRLCRPSRCLSARSSAAPIAAAGVATAQQREVDVEEAMVGFITGKRKATEVAHAVWRSIVQKGDMVVDATCGNGNDTLALLKMVADERGQGRVYGMDIQDSAIENTSSFLKMAVDDYHQRDLVKLFPVCHSRMEEIVPKDASIRLVAFNLGYLPGGDKTLITVPRTTELALQAASRILTSGGLISVLVYIGHPGGRDELDVVESFASSLPIDTWASCKLQMVNKPVAPVLILLNKK